MKTIVALCLVLLSQLSTSSAFSITFGARAPFAVVSAFAQRRSNNKPLIDEQSQKKTEAHASLLEYNAKCTELIEKERLAARLHYLAHTSA